MCTGILSPFIFLSPLAGYYIIWVWISPPAGAVHTCPSVCMCCVQSGGKNANPLTHWHRWFFTPPPPGRDSVVTPPISGSRKKKREQEKRAGATCRARQRGSAGHPLHPSVAICIKVTFHCNREKKKKKLRERILHMFFDLPKKSQN